MIIDKMMVGTYTWPSSERTKKTKGDYEHPAHECSVFSKGRSHEDNLFGRLRVCIIGIEMRNGPLLVNRLGSWAMVARPDFGTVRGRRMPPARGGDEYLKVT